MSSPSDKSSLKPAQPFRVFISYARKDDEHLIELEKHLSNLKQQGWIEPWTDRMFVAGDGWEDTLLEKLRESELVILLVSSDFNASGYIQDKELPLILERQKQNLVCVVPIIIRPVDIKGSVLADLQGLPLGRLRRLKPLTTWKNRDSAWLSVVKGLRERLEHLHSKQTNASAAPASLPIQPPTRAPRWRWALAAVSLLIAFTLFRIDWREAVPPPPLPTAIPLTLIWLEDERDPDFAGSLQDRKKLRTYLAEELVPALIRSGVAGIALDFHLSANTSVEGKAELQQMLKNAHTQVPAIPVIALHDADPLLPACSTPPNATTVPDGACFDGLVSDVFEDPAREPGDETYKMLDSCISGRPTLARVLADWLQQVKKQRTLERQEPAPTLQSGCENEKREWQFYPTEQIAWTEQSSGSIVDTGASRLGLNRQVVLVGMRDASFGDLHAVRMPSGTLLQEVPGTRLQATAAAVILASREQK